jgi:hypothetical protein
MTNQLTPGECILIIEGSSSITSVFSFDHLFSVNSINGKSKLVINEKIHFHAEHGHAEIYYEKTLYNPDILNHIQTSDCSKFYWSILSTGGMRQLKDTHGEEKETIFYSEIKEIHNKRDALCEDSSCKEVTLVEAKTIHGSDEGFYAWKTLQHINNHDDDNCHVVFDLGGETGQITGENSVYTTYLGKNRNKKDMGDSETETCSNDLGSYNGNICRTNIKEHIDTKFIELPNIGESSCKLYGVSNFYHFFNDVCKTYAPYIESFYFISNDTKEACSNQKTNNIVLTVSQYKDIADEACQHWNPEWTGNKAKFAKDACFSGNYNYQLLRAIGLSDNDFIYPDDSDWALGAAMSGTHSLAEYSEET